MNLINILLTGLSLASLNIQFVIVVASLIAFSSLCSRHSSSRYLAYYLAIFVAYPTSAVGQSGLISPPMYVLFASVLFLIHSAFYHHSSVRIGIKNTLLLLLMMIAALIVYLPIPLATYLSVHFYGPEERFVSNIRNSHMLSFVVPFFFSPLVAIAVTKSISLNTDFRVIYNYLKKATVIILLLSLARYLINVDFIPQEYTEIRFDGYRLTGFTDPDANGFARSLLLPIALMSSYVMSNTGKRIDQLVLMITIIALLMTFSRSAYISSSIMLFVIFTYNFSFSTVLRAFAFAFMLALIAYFSGIFDNMMARIVDGISLSGREVIFLSVLDAIFSSPYVGLRPGGWMEYLVQDVSYQGTTLRVQSTHSFYLETAVNWGIPVLVIFLAIIIFSVILSHRTICAIGKNQSPYAKNIRAWVVATTSLTIALLVHGIAEIVPYYLFFFLVGLSWSLHYMMKKKL